MERRSKRRDCARCLTGIAYVWGVDEVPICDQCRDAEPRLLQEQERAAEQAGEQAGARFVGKQKW